MKTGREYCLLALATALAGSIGIDAALAKVSVIQTPSAALARGSTFAWAPVGSGGIRSSDPSLNNEIAAGRLRAAVESSLLARGYRRAAGAGRADLIVSYFVVLQDRAEVSLNGAGGFCRPRFGCGPAPSYGVHKTEYTQGMLVLDLRERRSGSLVWRAASDKRVKTKDASQEMLNKELMAMTKSLPPA